MRSTILTLLVAAALLASGCALRSGVAEHWGEAYRETRAAQLANPEAPVTDEAPEGLDAITAELVAERYYKGQRVQRTREAPSVLIQDMQ